MKASNAARRRLETKVRVSDSRRRRSHRYVIPVTSRHVVRTLSPKSGDGVRPDWRFTFKAAIREINDANVQQLCERARHAIVDRLIDLAAEPQDAVVTAEREELEEALRKITQHEHDRSGLILSVKQVTSFL